MVAALSAVLRGNPHGEELRSGIANAARNTVFLRERDLKADLSDADRYVAFFKGALEFAIFPHARCLPYAASV